MFTFKVIFFLVLIAVSYKTQGQNVLKDSCDCNREKNVIFGGPEKMASFPGGIDELFKYLSKNLVYPEEAKINQWEDTVYVRFCIDIKGYIVQSEVIKGKYEILNIEALRVVNTMPKWEPAENRGSPICTSYGFPIKFILDKGGKKKKERNR